MFPLPGISTSMHYSLVWALRLVKPGGLVAAVCPSSYIAGPLFGPLRRHIRATAEVLRIDVLERKDVFHDVTQDACIAIFRRRKAPVTMVRPFSPKCGLIDKNWKFTGVGPASLARTKDDAPWVLPDPQNLDDRIISSLRGPAVRLRSNDQNWKFCLEPREPKDSVSVD